jgi:hypothetical protein
MSATRVTTLMHEVISRRAHRTSRRTLATLALQQGVVAAMTRAAQQILENGSYRERELCSKPFAARALFGAKSIARGHALKQPAQRLPLRPPIVWFVKLFAPRASNSLTCSGVTITVVVGI